MCETRGETWLTLCVPDSAVCLPGYCLYHRDREDGRQGGGVAVFSRDNLRCKPRPDLQKWCEDLWLEFPSNQSAKAHPLILGCYYRPPSSDLSAFLSALESSVSLTDYTRQDVLLVGDFNATSPSWLCTDSYNPAGSLLEPAFLQHGLTQHVYQPTHLRASGASTLDLILSSSPRSVSRVLCEPPLGKSDHCVISASLNFHFSQRPAHSRLRRLWAYDKADFGTINKQLLAVDWRLSPSCTVNEAWSAWKISFFDIINKHVPSKLVASPRPQVPWMTDSLRRSIKEKRAAFQRFKQCPSDAFVLLFVPSATE